MSELLGQRIRNFRVVDLLGKGGMGEVYVGYDETLERKVALKTIKAERRLDETAKARFLREARVLSQLHHPNICQIFDYISGDETDILVLELIKGKSLKHVARDLAFKQKLDVALQLTQVLIAAHEKGIVHRDLKPDNVMITEDGQVKVLDFGLSRSKVDEDTLILASSTAETLPSGVNDESDEPEYPPQDSSGRLTTDGMVMGTLGYMSPEQAQGEVATPASDIYSLGLVLQELFTGRSPYEKSGSAPELLRRAAEGQTVRIEGGDPGVTSLINRMKAIAVAARPSAIDVAERIQWIVGSPARRRKRVLTATVILALMMLSVFMTVQTRRAREAEESAFRSQRVATEEALAAEQAVRFLVSIWEATNPNRRETINTRELLEANVRKVESGFEGQPKLKARLLFELASIYSRLAFFEEASGLVKQSLGIRERLSDDEISTGAWQPTTDLAIADTLELAAEIRLQLGDYDASEVLFRRAINIREETMVPNALELWSARSERGVTLAYLGRLQEAEEIFQDGLEESIRNWGEESEQAVVNLQRLANVKRMTDRGAEAEALHRRILKIQESLNPNSVKVASALTNLVNYHFDRGEYKDAATMMMKAKDIVGKEIGTEHPFYAQVLWKLALARHNMASGSELPEDFVPSIMREALDILVRTKGSNNPGLVNYYLELGDVYRSKRRYDDAESQYLNALEIREGVVDHHVISTVSLFRALHALWIEQGLDSKVERFHKTRIDRFEKDLALPGVTAALEMRSLAHFYWKRERALEAEAFQRRAVEIYEAAGTTPNLELATAIHDLAMYVEKRDKKEAEDLYLKSVRKLEQESPEDSSEFEEFVFVMKSFARFLVVQGRVEEAIPYYEKSLNVRDEVWGASDQGSAEILGEVAQLYEELGRNEEAESSYVRSIEIYRREFGEAHPPLAYNLMRLADMYWDLKRRPEAEKTYRQLLSTTLATDPDSALGDFCLLRLGLLRKFAADLPAAADFFQRLLERGTLDRQAHYNLGRVYALSGRTERAFESLELAAQAGFNDPSIASDPDLISLRGNLRFERIVAEVKAKGSSGSDAMALR